MEVRRTHEVILEAKVIVEHLRRIDTHPLTPGTPGTPPPLRGGSYLHVQRLAQAVYDQGGLLIPHWVEVFVNDFASKNLPPGELELDIGVAAA